MSFSRRSFLTAAAALPALPAALAASDEASDAGRRAGTRASSGPAGFDPWLEIDTTALARNARAISRAVDRPVLAVVKNNAYGLGLAPVARALSSVEEVEGCAVVTAAAAVEIREAGFEKPIVLMGRVEDAEAADLVARGVRLTTIDASSARQVAAVSRRLDRPVPVHAYLDTGMNRVGISHRRAVAFLSQLAEDGAARIEGTFMGFAEDDAFDPVQLARFREVVEGVRSAGVDPGRLHAASSHGVFFRPDARLDMVRPGLVLYGAYPSGARDRGGPDLAPAFRLRARVARVERLEPGDGVSYGQLYVADRPTWIATLPVGHADGYPRRAVDGAEVLIGGRPYPVIGAVSASHTIVELGAERRAEPGDEAVLLGPDHPAVHPNTLAQRAGISVYDVLMHLSARLPRIAT